MKKMSFQVLVVAAAMVLMGSFSPVLAQRDAGAKARGEFGHGFWAQGNVNQSVGLYAPDQITVSASPAEGYRSFSYQPRAMPFQPGQQVVVRTNDARLMLGDELQATVPSGTTLEVLQTRNGWVGVHIQQDDQQVAGWIRQDQLGLAGGVTAPPEEVRSYSYEPAVTFGRASSALGSAGGDRGDHLENWRYQKTDPRRYQLHD